MPVILIIRVDADKRIGTGHFMRCLALAQECNVAGGKAIFVTNCRNKQLLVRLEKEGIDVRVLSRPFPDPGDWDCMKEVLATYPDAWVVLDGYHFDEYYQKRIRDSGYRLLVIDDMAHLDYYYGDIIVNQNLHADASRYSCEPETKLLMGTDYVLLRRQFLHWLEWRRKIPEKAKNILVTLGGADPDNCTEKVITSMSVINCDKIEIIIVVGAANNRFRQLEKLINREQLPAQLMKNVTNMPDLMAWADIAISSGGTTVWELAFMGLPSFVGRITPIEDFLVTGLVEHGLFIDVGWFKELAEEQFTEEVKKIWCNRLMREELSKLGRKVVDGYGCVRVLKEINSY